MAGGGGGNTATVAPIIGNLRIQTSAYSKAVPAVFGTMRLAGNLLDYDDFLATPVTTSQSSGGGGGKGGGNKSTNTNTTFLYSAMVLIALCEGPIASIGAVWRDKQQGVLADYFTDLFTGGAAQAAWTYLSTNHPGKALAYRRLAYAATAAMDLHDNAALGNFSFEVKRLTVDYGLPDAAVKDVIAAVITNGVSGLGQSGAILGDYTALHNYCGANNIWVSPAYIDREPAAGVLLRLANIANAGPFWSEDVLKIVPYGDTALNANGFNFVPNMAPQYDWTDKDYLDKDQPVRLMRKTPADLYNLVTGTFFNRANQYNEQTIEFKDQSDIELNGLKQDPNTRTYHEIALQASAQAVVDADGRRGLYGVTNRYATRVPATYDLLEPMDLVTLTDAALDLNRQLVRLVKIEEDADEGLNVEVEEVTVGTASPALYSSQAPGGYAGNYNADPGSVSAPVIFDLPGFVSDSGFELGIAAAGANALWGGSQVWVATDPSGPFKQFGSIFGRARYGTVSAPFAAGADPDTVNTCSVDLSLSKGVLTGGTQADADNRNTLSWIEGELVSFQTALLTSTYHYDLKTYLRRGVFNTPVAAHVATERFVRLDQAVFHYPYAPDMIGKTIYVKLLSFNIFGGGQQNLAAAVSYPYVIGGPSGAPDVVKNFIVSQNGNVAVCQWDFLTASNISGYEIRYNPRVSRDPRNWDMAALLTQVTKGTQITTAKLPPGDWTCLIKAVDKSQKYSLSAASANIVMTNSNTVIALGEQSTDWRGFTTPPNNFVVHQSGVLIPESTRLANAHTNAELFTQFVPYPVAFCQYDTPEIDLGADGTVRIHEDVVAALGPGIVTGIAAPSTFLDYRPNGGAYRGFQAWAIGNLLARFLKGRITLAPATGKAVISKFAVTADTPSAPVQVNNLAVPAGGLVFVFASRYYFPPNVQATPIATSGVQAAVSGITNTQCTINVYDTTNASVGGTVNLTINGATGN